MTALFYGALAVWALCNLILFRWRGPVEILRYDDTADKRRREAIKQAQAETARRAELNRIVRLADFRSGRAS